MAYGDGSYGDKKPKPTTTTKAPAQKPSGGSGSTVTISGGGGGRSDSAGSSAPSKGFNKQGVGKPAASTEYDVEDNLTKLAAKLAALTAQNKPKKAEAIGRELRENLSGYDLTDINQMAAKSGIPQGVTEVLRRYVRPRQKGAPVTATVLDYVGRPGQAVVGGITEGGLNPTSPDFQRGFERGFTGKESYSPAAAVVKQATGMRKSQANREVESWNPVVRFGAELGAGVVLDPTTYVSFGTTAGSKAAIDAAAEITAAARLAKAGETAVKQADTVAGLRAAIRSVGAKKALTPDEFAALGPKVKRALRGDQGGIKLFGNTVVPGKTFDPLTSRIAGLGAKAGETRAGAAIEGTTRTVPGFRQAERAGTVDAGTVEQVQANFRRAESARAFTNEDWTVLSKAGAKVKTDASRLRITQAIENPALVADLDEVEREAYDVVQRVLDAKTELVEQSGRATMEEPYFPHIRTEASAKAGTLGLNPASLSASTPGFARTRTIREPVETVIDKTTGEPLFETDPFVATFKHSAAVNADVARTRFVEDMRAIKDTQGRSIIRGSEDLTDAEKAAISDAAIDTPINGQVVKEVPYREVGENGETILRKQKVLVDPMLAKDPAFDRVMKVFADPSHAEDLKNFYKKAMQLWKSYATTFGPFSGGFGMRNFLGNQINGYFLTGTNPAWQAKSFRVLGKLSKGAKEGDPWKYLSAAERKEMTEAFETGVIGSGFYTEDTGARNLTESLRRLGTEGRGKRVVRAINPLDLDNMALRFGRAFNGRIEETARMGLFMAKRRGGFTPDTASRLVQKFLFDYGELSQADRAIKNVIPFWTWTRKNLPLQLEVLFKTPGAASAQAHFIDAAQSLEPNYDRAALPDWAAQSDAIVLPGGKNAVMPDIPLTSIQDQLRPIMDLPAVVRGLRGQGPEATQQFFRDLVLAFQPAGPGAGLIGAATQQALGKDLFSGREYRQGDRTGPLPSGLESFIEQTSPVGPGIAKIRGILNDDTRLRKAVSGLLGIQSTELSKKSKTSEQYRRLDDLQTLADWLAAQGIRLPTLDYVPKEDRKVSK